MKDKMIISLIVSFLVLAIVLVTGVYLMSKKESFSEYAGDDLTTQAVYDPDAKDDMLAKAKAVAYDYVELMQSYGITMGEITEDMIAYSVDTSQVYIIFDRYDGEVYLWLKFDENGSVINYEVMEPNELGDVPEGE